MNALVVYDSAFGNTEKIAHAIRRGLKISTNVVVRHVEQIKSSDLEGLNLLILGSPTQRFSPTKKVNDFLKSIPAGGLRGVKVAAFDTRFTQEKIGEIRILDIFVSIFGYAAQPIANAMKKKGGELLVEPEGFYVADTEGPLLEDEIARAEKWAQTLNGSPLATGSN
jgi:flavodoxin